MLTAGETGRGWWGLAQTQLLCVLWSPFPPDLVGFLGNGLASLLPRVGLCLLGGCLPPREARRPYLFMLSRRNKSQGWSVLFFAL